MASSTSLFFGSTAVVTPKAVPVCANSGCKSPSSSNVVCMASKGQEVKQQQGRREALRLAAALVLGGGLALASADKAKADLIEELLAKSAANKELNDKKRLATSYANTARAYTVTNGTCKFPDNFTGCQDLAKRKNVPFLSDDLKVECEGKDKFKCGSNVFWKW
eukprot:c25503_g1_i1 orf=266-757(+)